MRRRSWSINAVRAAEHGTVAQYGHGAIVAHRDHGGEWIVVAVATAGSVPSSSERLDAFLRRVAGHEPHAELTKHAFGVEDRGAVDLCEGVTQRGEVSGFADLQRWRRREAFLHLWT